MSRQYHYLIAGFPDLFFDDSKISINMEEFRLMLGENLPEEDMDIIHSYFYRYDSRNILAKLKGEVRPYDRRGVLTEADLESLFEAVKEGPESYVSLGVLAYFGKFVEAYKTESPLFESKSWELQLSELYYRLATSQSNPFIRNWYAFERDSQNIITAGQCRKHNIPVENQLVGSGELVERLSRSNARDFGLGNEFPYIEQLLKIIEEEDIKEYERKIDRIRWNYLDEAVFFHYFTIEKLFSFVVKLCIVERWLSLDKETGNKLFNELLSSLETSYEFPEEYKI